MVILLTGGSGKLGTELQKYIKVHAPSSRELDITSPINTGKYDLVIHAAAYTNVLKAETDRKACFDVNVMGTVNLLKAYKDTPFVYISSEYANKPVNYYSETKRAAEMAVEAYAKDYTIIRTLFKPRPYPYERAFYDQWTQGDYLDVITPLIIEKLHKRNNSIVYVGTGRKTILDLAMKSKPTIQAASLSQVEGVILPKDYI